MIADTNYANLPPILDIVEPVLEEAPTTLQNDLRDLIIALYRASAQETTFMLKHVLVNSQNPMTLLTLRRISRSFPPTLQSELNDILRPRPVAPATREIADPESRTMIKPSRVELEKLSPEKTKPLPRVRDRGSEMAAKSLDKKKPDKKE